MKKDIAEYGYNVVEYLTVPKVGLITSFVGLLLGQTSNSRFLLATIVVVVLVVVYILRRFIPSIGAKWKKVDNETTNPNPIDVENREATVEFQFEIPDHHEEIYITFEIDSYNLSITQSDPVNFDLDRGITYHSPIREVDLLLKLELEPDIDSAGTVPLEIVDKLNSRTIETIEISS